MRRLFVLLAGIALTSVPVWVEGQTFTMSKKCKEALARASEMNNSKAYDSALTLLSSVEKGCNSIDGKEAVQCAKARAYNGKKQFSEAVAASDAALKASKNKSLNAYFERAIAKEGLGDAAGAEADFKKIIELTEKNQNVRERATLYAKVADMNYQAGKTAEGDTALAKAMALDPANPAFAIQQGDRYVREGNYGKAFENYDKAVGMGKTDLEMYKIRTGARMKMVQDKYGTTNAQELRSKMNSEEKNQVCTELKKALELGLNDMKLEMFSALVCK